ncbi:hypothetical protein EDB82DRAFT_546081 [Fusarium venenatum]|uniref:uncharacterized protein n=1 Tax=Fusarium venenatum TaxID=56646 RepID=UPI001DE41891|nr:hypothetical protein EDB82DRAFT_546081 [Fusarium venenatum]
MATSDVSIIYVPADCGSIIPGKSKAPKAFQDVGIVSKLKEAGVPPVLEIGALYLPATYTAATFSPGGVRNEDINISVCESVEHADPDSIGTFAGMNMAHLVRLPGALPRMEQFSRPSGEPVCDSSNTVLFGTNMSLPGNKPEHFQYIFDNNYKVVSSASVAKEPEQRARETLEYLESKVDMIMVHLDVDSIDPGTFPLANVPNFTGVEFEQMMRALRVLLASDKVVGLTVAEFSSHPKFSTIHQPQPSRPPKRTLAMGNTYSLMFPPKPQFTEENLEPQDGRVFIVTGGYSGIGFELCRMLYEAGGSVYIAGRSQEKGEQSIAQLKEHCPGSSGKLAFLKISLDDLESVKSAAEEFATKESRLDVLFNNAGVSMPPPGSVSAQGYELSIATNAIGPWYFTQLLVPLLTQTAKDKPPASVRVVWTASIVTDVALPKGGVNMKDVITPSSDPQVNYTNSKSGNWYLASVLADQIGSQGVLSVCHNPGNLQTSLLRHMPLVFGAYTNLWAGLSPDLQIEDGGSFQINRHDLAHRVLQLFPSLANSKIEVAERDDAVRTLAFKNLGVLHIEFVEIAGHVFCPFSESFRPDVITGVG